MKLFRSFLILTTIIAMTACTALGIPVADTFNKKLEVGYVTVDTVATSTNNLLISGTLSKSDASNILEQGLNAKAALDIARSVHDTSPALGDAKLASALVVLQALQKYVGTIPTSTGAK